MVERIRVKLEGRVQGVFFRHSAKQEAERLGIVGRIENKKDGSLFCEAEGESKRLYEFCCYLLRGPVAAKVRKIELEYVPPKNSERGFIIQKSEDD